MKTRTLIMACLLLGIGLTHISGQDSNSAGTRTYQYWMQTTYWAPVFCGNEFQELLEGGVISVHVVAHYKDGNYKWEIDQIKGHVTSSISGEVFQIRGEVDKWYLMGGDWYLTWHNNLKGDQGTHYIGDVTVNWTKWLFYPGNNRCL